MAAFETRHIAVEGVRSPVLTGGAGAPGEAVVFVHGNPDAGSDWLPLMEPVAEFATVVAPDMPGFGDADKPENWDYTVKGYAAHLAGLLDQLGVERAHLVAHDFGGPWALQWAADHPEKVGSVTVINTGVFIGLRWHRLARIWRTPIAGELFMWATTPWVARFVVRHDNPGLPKEWVDKIVAHARPEGTKRAVLRLYRATSRDESESTLAEPMRALDPDTLVVWGDADVYLPAVQAERQREVFPRAQIEMLPGVGHWAWLEQPDRVAGLVVPFLRDRVGRVTQ
jgi:pimeloyl-ACP methyl ester carboxylesterase